MSKSRLAITCITKDIAINEARTITYRDIMIIAAGRNIIGNNNIIIQRSIVEAVLFTR